VRSRFTYDARGNRTETAANESGTVIRTFDRSGIQIREEYLSTDGKRATHLEKQLAFSYWEAQYDRYRRLQEQRYYDANDRLFRFVKKVFDPTGNEVESSLGQLKDEIRRVMRTVLMPTGRDVGVSLRNAVGERVADEFGRSRWMERFDKRGNRLEINYRGILEEAIPYKGHIHSLAKYDDTSWLTEVVYLIPLGEDEILQKTFRFGATQSRHLRFAGWSAYVLEYTMRAGDESLYRIVIENRTGGDELRTLEIKMRQRCEEVRPDGSYLVRVDVLDGHADWQADAKTQVQMRMARSGQILETSVGSEFPLVPFPTHPVFVGESWEKEVPVPVLNPFTGKNESLQLQYTYQLQSVTITRAGLKIAQIDATCPTTEFEMGLDATMSITVRGIMLFDVENGLLVQSQVQVEIASKAGGQEVTSQVRVSVALQSDK
jgi:hypothetical protein